MICWGDEDLRAVPCFAKKRAFAVLSVKIEFLRERVCMFHGFRLLLCKFSFGEDFRVTFLLILGTLYVLWWTLSFGFSQYSRLVTDSWS